MGACAMQRVSFSSETMEYSSQFTYATLGTIMRHIRANEWAHVYAIMWINPADDNTKVRAAIERTVTRVLQQRRW